MDERLNEPSLALERIDFNRYDETSLIIPFSFTKRDFDFDKYLSIKGKSLSNYWQLRENKHDGKYVLAHLNRNYERMKTYDFYMPSSDGHYRKMSDSQNEPNLYIKENFSKEKNKIHTIKLIGAVLTIFPTNSGVITLNYLYIDNPKVSDIIAVSAAMSRFYDNDGTRSEEYKKKRLEYTQQSLENRTNTSSFNAKKPKEIEDKIQLFTDKACLHRFYLTRKLWDIFGVQSDSENEYIHFFPHTANHRTYVFNRIFQHGFTAAQEYALQTNLWETDYDDVYIESKDNDLLKKVNVSLDRQCLISPKVVTHILDFNADDSENEMRFREVRRTSFVEYLRIINEEQTMFRFMEDLKSIIYDDRKGLGKKVRRARLLKKHFQQVSTTYDTKVISEEFGQQSVYDAIRGVMNLDRLEESVRQQSDEILEELNFENTRSLNIFLQVLAILEVISLAADIFQTLDTSSFSTFQTFLSNLISFFK